MTLESLQPILAWIATNPTWMGVIVFLTALGESLAVVGLLVPGAIMMAGFGALIALGHLQFWPVFAWAVAGAVVGDGVSFWLGRTFHQRLRQLWPFSRHPQLLIRGENFFLRHGGKSILFGRFFGPVRAVVPAVAGMLDMPTGRFLLVNVSSALVWAPAYLLPGLVVGASLELASQVALRLVILILLLVALLWFTAWLVRGLFRLLQPRVNVWLRAFSEWSRDRPLLGPIGASLIDPAHGELRGLAALAALLVGGMVFFIQLVSALGHGLPTGLDQNLYRFLQDLRTPWADRLMIFITELGSFPVLLSLTTTVLFWLVWKRARSAAWHWLAALSFAAIMAALFNWVFPSPQHRGDPSPLLLDHVVVSAILFGFLAVLIARETVPYWRWLPYLAATLLVTPIAFSRLYLGIHWLTDSLAGLSLGLIWVTLLGLAYNRHPAKHVERPGLVLVSVVVLTGAALVQASLNHAQDLLRYQTRTEIRYLSLEQWWQDGWRQLPAYRTDFRGEQRQALIIQWATSLAELKQHLHTAGWQSPPPLTLTNALMRFNPQAGLEEFPVLPRVHDGHHEELSLIRAGEGPATRWVLRFWAADVRLEDSNTPIWLGSLTLQRLEQRMGLLSIAADISVSQPLHPLLAPVLAELPHRLVVDPTNPERPEVLLIHPS